MNTRLAQEEALRIEAGIYSESDVHIIIETEQIKSHHLPPDPSVSTLLVLCLPPATPALNLIIHRKLQFLQLALGKFTFALHGTT